VTVVTYYVGEDDEHLVDHPPIFACREHKRMLRLASRFVDELIATGEDIMPGNPQEIVGSFLPPAEPAYRLPEFLLPPKVILYNPRALRGAEALPYAVVLVDKRFYGIPARYLTPDRFTGCDECRNLRRRPKPRARAGGPTPRPGSGPLGKADSGVRRGPPAGGPPAGGTPAGGTPAGGAPAGGAPARGPGASGVRRPSSSSSSSSGRRPPPQSGPQPPPRRRKP
jgi:hypothetical protein